MSRYESRAAVIRAAAAAMDWRLRWTRQRSRIYLHVDIGDSKSGHITVGDWVNEWYPGAVMTSWGSRGGTYFICDIWQVLKS